jgi:hypothetical protein
VHWRGRLRLQRMPAAESRLAECWRNSPVPADTAKGIEQEVQACITLFDRGTTQRQQNVPLLPTSPAGVAHHPDGAPGPARIQLCEEQGEACTAGSRGRCPARIREHEDLRPYRGARRLCTVGSMGRWSAEVRPEGMLDTHTHTHTHTHVHRSRQARLDPGGRPDYLSCSSRLRISRLCSAKGRRPPGGANAPSGRSCGIVRPDE